MRRQAMLAAQMQKSADKTVAGDRPVRLFGTSSFARETDLSRERDRRFEAGFLHQQRRTGSAFHRRDVSERVGAA